ncbi:MAG: hydrogen gas-evolving membrane-bound hydrogenase subunit E [Pseudomonadota bacterium]
MQFDRPQPAAPHAERAEPDAEAVEPVTEQPQEAGPEAHPAATTPATSSTEHAVRPCPAGPAMGILLALAALGVAAALSTALPDVRAGGSVGVAWPWVEPLGIQFAFRLDGLSMVFAPMIAAFAAAIALYSRSYLRGHQHLGRFFVYLGLFTASMLGLVLADDIILMFVFWEMTTVASFLLVGFSHASEKSRRNAWQGLLVTGAGGLALLAGLVLLASAAGTTSLSAIVATEGLTGHALYPGILALVLLGAFTKSAQIPFHFWLPGAMAAPTPVSAFLHSATMVKAGVYLVARLHPAMSGTEAWTWSLSITGAITMLMAGVLALRQTDLKMALAYTSIMALGSLIMFLGAEATVAIAAAVTFLIVHALYKASLFLMVGCIDKGTGTREIASLGGLWRTMPFTSTAAVLAAGSMAGFPPFLGFIGKELKYEGALAIAEEPWPLATAAVTANACMVAMTLIIILRVVFGRAGTTPKSPREVPIAMWLPPLALASLGLVFGIAPDLVGNTLVQPAVTAILGRPETVALKLWHGINVPLAMSIATVVLGIVLFVAHKVLLTAMARMPVIADRAWDGLMAGIADGFKATTRVMQPGSLRSYVAVTLTTLSALPLAYLAFSAHPLPQLKAPVFEWTALGVVLLTAVGAVMAAAAARRMVALGGLGAVGTGLAMLFAVYGAPDVAMTQLLADVLLVVLIAAVMARLPDLGGRRSGRLRDIAVASLVGVSVTVLILASTAGGYDRALPDSMIALSVPEAFGRNVVNVILVDFRALDTFGEIVVVAVAAVAALALIRTRRRAT